MTDPRNRLRPLLHSGMAFKVNNVVAEVLARDEPALYDWILDAVYPDETWLSPYWQWRTDDTSEYQHPSLAPEVALRLVARGTSERAKDLREAITKLCIQLGFNRRTEPVLDVRGCEGMTSVRKLRVLGHEPENEYAWREKVGKLARPLVGFAAIATMTALEHLTLIACQLDPAVIGTLPALRFLEIVGGDLADLAPLAGAAIEDLALVGCKQLTVISALPRTLKRLHVEDCGVEAIPATTAQVTFSRTPISRNAMTRSVFESS